MNYALIKKGPIGGDVLIPPAKSYGHRSIISAALSNEPSLIHNVDMSEDMKATLNFLKALGGSFEYENRTLHINPINRNIKECEIDCGESGSTLRFIIPILASLGVKAKLTGKGRLPERPLTLYTELLPSFGVNFTSNHLPLELSGQLKSGIFKLRGDVSSQFISGLLFALPMLNGDSEIEIIGSLESGAYIDMTIEMLKLYGVKIEKIEKGYFVKGNSAYKASDYTVEGDWSQAAFFMTMGALSEDYINVQGLNLDSIQGDKETLKLYEKIGADIKNENGVIKIKKGKLNPINADMHDMPDAVPALAALLSLCDGRSVISGAKRLRIKESDRLKAISEAINALGGKIKETDDGLIIDGVKKLKGNFVSSCNDHRILMAMASVKKETEGEIKLTDPMCVNKSYPGFYDDYKKLGGEADVIYMG